jgi:hypothetical protein
MEQNPEPIPADAKYFWMMMTVLCTGANLMTSANWL